MKLKALIGMVLFCLSGVVFSAGGYFPPERMQCRLNDGNLTCENFNRQYLREATYGIDLPSGRDFVFLFSSGTAYHSEQNEWAIYYTYKEPISGKRIRIKTINTNISPDLVRGSWQGNNDFYVCHAGYMSCSMNPI